MKTSTASLQKYKLIATHALVIAIVAAPYFTAIWGDIFNIFKTTLVSVGILTTTTAATPVVMSETQIMSMSFLSSLAAFIALVAFAVYLFKKHKM